MMDMDRTKICLALIGTLIMLSSTMAGCLNPLRPWDRPGEGGMPDDMPGGCFYEGTSIELENDFMVLLLEQSEWDHADNLTNANMNLTIKAPGYGEWTWNLSYDQFADPADPSYKAFSFDLIPTFTQHRIELNLPEEVWVSFSIEFHIDSPDQVLATKEYFNGGNTIVGTMMVQDGGDTLDVQLGKDYEGFSIYPVNKLDESAKGIILDHDEIDFGFIFRNEVACIG